MRRATQILVSVLGCAVIGIALAHIVLGGASVMLVVELALPVLLFAMAARLPGPSRAHPAAQPLPDA
jgi:hypothetical protein